jgi:hypothetical protein
MTPARRRDILALYHHHTNKTVTTGPHPRPDVSRWETRIVRKYVMQER